MKYLLSLCMACLLTASAQNQNVGINTSTPQLTLDVKGNQRVGGNTRFTTFDSLAGKIEWRNANLYAPVSQYLMQHSAAGDGLYYNNNTPISGQLEYRNATGNPVFYTNFTNGNGYFKSNLGINNLTPQFPLSFNGSLGDKISLWTDGTPTHYGFGIQSSLFQMFSKTSFDDIGFGYGSSTTFVEAMRIKGNGNVGIGTISPGQKLEVSGNLKGNNFLYNSPKTYHYSLSGTDFTGEKNNDNTYKVNGIITMENTSPNKTIYAPVHLPDGAVLVNMKVYIDDNRVNDNLTVSFFRKDITSPFFPVSYGAATSSGSGGGIIGYQVPFLSSTVDNNIYSYFITATLDNNTGIWFDGIFLHQVVIEYTMSAAQ